jgi:hypothetical protein
VLWDVISFVPAVEVVGIVVVVVSLGFAFGFCDGGGLLLRGERTLVFGGVQAGELSKLGLRLPGLL